MLCPACAAENPDEDLFCESCGQRLAAQPELPPTPPDPNACPCGAPAAETDSDGYCLRCGRRSRTAELLGGGPDHCELAISPAFAAVSDRGLKHLKNEDRFGIVEIGGAFAIVVCDGVSTSRDPERASAAVAEGALESLSLAMQLAAAGGIADPAAAIRHAIAAGAARAQSLALSEHEDNPPSTTVVAALIAGAEITVGWMGDSRAYWLDAAGAHPLTRDHSWLNAVLSTGELPPEVAAKSPQAHAITRWIGADSGADLDQAPEVEIASRQIVPPGTLLLCTDGLWNYYPTEVAMAGIVAEAAKASGQGSNAHALARYLVQSANRRGGHDNITAAVLQLGGEDPPTAPIPPPIEAQVQDSTQPE